MKLSELGEFAFIDRIAPRRLAGDPGRAVQAIGDDAAVVRTGDGLQLVTTDLLVEGVHFLLDRTAPRRLGRKALAVNLSDIAAMGGTPHEVYVALAAPGDTDVELLDEIYRGMEELGGEHRVSILGGDTSSSPGPLFLCLTVVGSVPEGQLLLRSAGRPGDLIAVTGTLGDSAAGLRLLLESLEVPEALAVPLVRAHLDPAPAVAAGRALASSGVVHAAIDLSDGLVSDLGHVCERSGVGALVDADRLPISDEVRELCRRLDENPLELALYGGEDYRLLVSVSRDAVDRARRDVEEIGGSLYVVGELTERGGLRLRHADGRVEPAADGWAHFHQHCGGEEREET